MPDDDKPRYASLSGVDPYVDWVLGEGREFYFPPGQQTWLTVLVRLNNISAVEFAEGKPFATGSDNKTWKEAVIVPELYTKGPDANSKGGTNCFALVTDRFFTFLTNPEGLRKFTAHVELSLPLDENAFRVPGKPQAAAKAKPKAKSKTKAKAKSKRRKVRS